MTLTITDPENKVALYAARKTIQAQSIAKKREQIIRKAEKQRSEIFEKRTYQIICEYFPQINCTEITSSQEYTIQLANRIKIDGYEITTQDQEVASIGSLKYTQKIKVVLKKKEEYPHFDMCEFYKNFIKDLNTPPRDM